MTRHAFIFLSAASLLLAALAPAARAGTDPLDLIYGGRPIKQWIADLDDKDRYSRQDAADRLGKIGPLDERIGSALVAALRHEDFETRGRVAFALRDHGPAAKKAVPALIKLLSDKNRYVRLAALEALAAIREPSEEVIQAAVAILSKPADDFESIFDKRDAAILLGNLGPAAKRTVPTLQKVLRGTIAKGGATDSQAIARALAKIDPVVAEKMTPEVIQLLKDPKPPVRNAAAHALLGFGPAGKGGVPALAHALSDGDSYVRKWSATALGAMGPAAKDAEKALLAALQTRDAFSLEAVANTLLLVAPERDKEVAGVLADRIRQKIIGRGVLITPLGKLRAAANETVPLLISVVKDRGTDFSDRSRAIQALGELGAEAKDAVPTLITLLEGTDFLDAGAAASALGKIGPEAKDALPILTKSEKLSRREVAIVLCQIERKVGPKALKDLSDELKEQFGGDLAADALAVLGAGAAPFVSHLAEGLQSKDARTRRAFAKALGKIGPAAQKAVPALSAALKDSDPFVRENAALALGEIGPGAKEAMDTLRLLQDDPFEFVRRAADAASRKIQVPTQKK